MGLDLHVESKQRAGHTSGGHPCCRTMVNILIAGHWNQILHQLIKPARPDGRDRFIIVCPGDKYAKTTAILDGALRYDPKVWYPIDEDWPRNRIT